MEFKRIPRLPAAVLVVLLGHVGIPHRAHFRIPLVIGVSDHLDVIRRAAHVGVKGRYQDR